jgi:hypothetical protein
MNDDTIYYVMWEERRDEYDRHWEQKRASFTLYSSAMSYAVETKKNLNARNVELAIKLDIIDDFGLTQRSVEIAYDGRCMCSCADPCALGRGGMEERCTEEELKAAGIPTKRI